MGPVRGSGFELVLVNIGVGSGRDDGVYPSKGAGRWWGQGRRRSSVAAFKAQDRSGGVPDDLSVRLLREKRPILLSTRWSRGTLGQYGGAVVRSGNSLSGTCRD